MTQLYNVTKVIRGGVCVLGVGWGGGGNIVRTVRRTRLRFLMDYDEMQDSARTCGRSAADSMIQNVWPHNTTQHNTTRHDTTRHNTTPLSCVNGAHSHSTCPATQHNTTQHDTTPLSCVNGAHSHSTCPATQHNTTRHNTTQHRSGVGPRGTRG